MTAEPVTVFVPDAVGKRVLSGIDGICVVRYESMADLVRLGADAEVLIPGFRPTDATTALLNRLPRLRLVQLRSAGAERWIHRVPPGVAVSDCRGAHSGLTAEWVITGLLSTLREFPAFLRSQERHRWERRPSDTLVGKRVLLVGAGDVSDAIVRRLDGFDLSGLTRVGRAEREGVHAADELPALLPAHHVVVLVVPLTRQTARMVDARFLAAMPDGGIFVNASRGPVVDTDALLAELRTRRLRAVLDVIDPDPLPAGHPLWDEPGVLITPHIAGIGTRSQWRERAYAVIRDQLSAVALGQQPPNLVVDDY